MTIAAAWVRTLKDCKELIIVSDSRLNGGKKMDCGQKVLALPRSDAFICLAGDTSWAYPLIHQVASAISIYEKSASRAQDIVELKSHVLKVFEGLRLAVHDGIDSENIPAAEFLFGGYSWIRKKFMIWRISFQLLNKKDVIDKIKEGKHDGRFIATPAKEWQKNPFIFAGDKEHVCEAKKRLKQILKSRKKSPEQVTDFKFDWEPFEVIRDMLNDVNSDITKYKESSIGGAPQILKIYEYLSSRYLGVEWSIKYQTNGKGVFVCGRKILGYETPMLWILDPDTLVTSHPFYTEHEDKRLPDIADAIE